jgi:hypothetical protein
MSEVVAIQVNEMLTPKVVSVMVKEGGGDVGLDAIEAELIIQNNAISAIEAVQVAQSTAITDITAEQTTQNNAISAIEAVQVAQSTAISDITAEQTTQNNAISAIEAVQVAQSTAISDITAEQTTQNNAIGAIEVEQAAQSALIFASHILIEDDTEVTAAMIGKVLRVDAATGNNVRITFVDTLPDGYWIVIRLIGEGSVEIDALGIESVDGKKYLTKQYSACTVTHVTDGVVSIDGPMTDA